MLIEAEASNEMTEQECRFMDIDYHPQGETEEKKMGYNPQNAKEEPALPVDTIFTAIIIAIKDGRVREFVKGDLTKWKNPDETAINVSMEVLHNEKKHNFDNIFTYEEENGVTKYSEKSNLGKFKNKYNKLPEVGDQVKAMTNKDGFLRLILK